MNVTSFKVFYCVLLCAVLHVIVWNFLHLCASLRRNVNGVTIIASALDQYACSSKLL